MPPSPVAPPLNTTLETGIVSEQTANELDAGGIAGIVIGSVVFLCCCIGVCVGVYCMRRGEKAPPRGIEKLTATTVEVDVVSQESFRPLPPSLEELAKMDEGSTREDAEKARPPSLAMSSDSSFGQSTGRI